MGAGHATILNLEMHRVLRVQPMIQNQLSNFLIITTILLANSLVVLYFLESGFHSTVQGGLIFMPSLYPKASK